MVVMKSLIYNLRFGTVDIKNLSREEILQVLDYYVPHDVIQLCLDEIACRRDANLEQQRDRDNKSS